MAPRTRGQSSSASTAYPTRSISARRTEPNSSRLLPRSSARRDQYRSVAAFAERRDRLARSKSRNGLTQRTAEKSESSKLIALAPFWLVILILDWAVTIAVTEAKDSRFDEPELPRVWNRRRPINYPKQIEVTGGIAAPLLVGFSLTAIAELAAGKDHFLSEVAIALFAVASVLLVYAMQFSASALGYAATPSDRLDYSPEAASRLDVLRIVRWRQWQEMELRAKYTERVKICYNCGLIAFLGGLEFVIFPHHHDQWGRIIGALVVGISIVIEIIWACSNASKPKFLLPTYDPVEPDDVVQQGADYLFPKDNGDDIAAGLRRCVELLEQISSRDPR
jgi:hypothetical protein